MRLTRLLLVVIVAAAVPVVAYAATRSDDDASGSAAQDREPAGCDVAAPKPGSALSGSFDYKVTVVAPLRADDPTPPGTTQGRSRPNGAIYAKILWRRDPRRARGRMKVTGRRLDGAPGSLRTTLNQGNSDFVPSSLVFSSAGCWSVTARSGKARVRYVVRVVNLATAG